MRRWLVFGVLVAALSTGLWAAAEEEEEVSFWDSFKLMFVDWDDDNYEDDSGGKTEVVGLRGVNVEEALGSDKYDWDDLRKIEDFNVSPDQVKSFLEQGQLGPYK